MNAALGQVIMPNYSQTPRLKATHKSPMLMQAEPPKRATSLYELNFLEGQELGEAAFYGNHTVGELDMFAREFDNLEDGPSLPDLGGVSVDYAHYEDYQKLEQNQNFFDYA